MNGMPRHERSGVVLTEEGERALAPVTGFGGYRAIARAGSKKEARFSSGLPGVSLPNAHARGLGLAT
jgi:hypothetical protein